MQTTLRTAAMAAILGISTPALGQRALILQDTDPWGYTSLQTELGVQGVPFDIVGTGAIAAVDPTLYTMVFIQECQADSIYNEWNAAAGAFEPWINNGGFVSIKACHVSCGLATGNVLPLPPGIAPVSQTDFVATGLTIDPGHALMVGVPANPTGGSLAHNSFISTGEPTDSVLIENMTGDPVYFERVYGQGLVVMGGLTQTFGYQNSQDAGIVLINEITVGLTYDGCGALDSDADGVGDDCDICPLDPLDDADGDGLCADVDPCPNGDNYLDGDGDGVVDGCDLCEGFDDAFDLDGDTIPDDCDQCAGADDLLDADGDTVPDACDLCPNGSDVDDTDLDGIMDGCDNCPNDGNANQTDTDGDGVGDTCDLCAGVDDAIDGDGDSWPDACDNCPVDFNDIQTDGDSDGFGDACDVCPGFDDLVDQDLDGIADACDNCPAISNVTQDDIDGDSFGDACDICAGFNDAADFDGDLVPDGCDICPQDALDDSDGDGVCDSRDMCDGFDDAIDSDGDTFPDDCDDCPNTAAPGQRDEDGDGFGFACECDDQDDTVNPDATEICDGVDNDCDGDIDNNAADGTEFFADTDQDQQGDATNTSTACTPPAGFVDNSDDCDDSDAAVNTNATEICDTIDNNCDGVIDDVPDCETAPGADDKDSSGCSCDAASGAPAGFVWMLMLALVIRRRR